MKSFGFEFFGISTGEFVDKESKWPQFVLDSYLTEQSVESSATVLFTFGSHGANSTEQGAPSLKCEPLHVFTSASMLQLLIDAKKRNYSKFIVLAAHCHGANFVDKILMALQEHEEPESLPETVDFFYPEKNGVLNGRRGFSGDTNRSQLKVSNFLNFGFSRAMLKTEKGIGFQNFMQKANTNIAILLATEQKVLNQVRLEKQALNHRRFVNDERLRSRHFFGSRLDDFTSHFFIQRTDNQPFSNLCLQNVQKKNPKSEVSANKHRLESKCPFFFTSRQKCFFKNMIFKMGSKIQRPEQ